MRLKGYLRGLGAGIFISAVLMGIASPGKDTLSDEEIKKRAAALGMVEEDSVLVKPKIEETIPELPAADNNEEKKDTDIKKPETEEKSGKNSSDAKDEGSSEADKGSDGQEEQEKDGKTQESDEDIRAKEDRAMGGQNDTAAPAENAESPVEKTEGQTEKIDKQDEKTDSPTENVDKQDEKTDSPAEKADKQEEKTDNKTESFTLQIASGTTSYSVAKLLQKGGVIKDADDFDEYLCNNHYDHRINHGVFKIPAGAGYEEIARIITGGK